MPPLCMAHRGNQGGGSSLQPLAGKALLKLVHLSLGNRQKSAKSTPSCQSRARKWRARCPGPGLYPTIWSATGWFSELGPDPSTPHVFPAGSGVAGGPVVLSANTLDTSPSERIKNRGR